MKNQTYRFKFSHESVLARPAVFLKEAFADLVRAWELGCTFFVRDIKAQYRLSFLGLFWSIVPPLLFVAGFSLAASTKTVDFGETPIPYPAFAMLSIMIWHTFSACIEAPILGFKDARPLIGRLRFSVESVFLSKILMVLFNLGIKLVLVLAALFYFGVELSPSALLAIFPLVSLMVFGLFIGVVLAPLTLLINDLAQGLSFFTTFWMLATPVVYVVDQGHKHYDLMLWNPAASLVSSVREVFLSMPMSYELPFYIVSSVGLAGLFIFWLVSKIALPFITERAGAS